MQGDLNSQKHYAIQDEPPMANTDHIQRKFIDIPYAGGSPSQKLDIYLPEEIKGRIPVILWFHGGAFMGCDKADLQVLPALEGLNKGYAVVSINYRMSWEAKYPSLIYDAKAAVRWVRANADSYQFDPYGIVAWGASAGAYLAIILGTTSGLGQFEDLRMGNSEYSSAAQAVVDWFGPSDFLMMDQQLIDSGLPPLPGMEHNSADSPESLLFGQKLTEIPDKVKAANPVNYITQNVPPFFIQHGTRDAVVPAKQSIILADKLKTAVGDDMVTFELLEGAEHADPRFEARENVNKVFDFLDKYLKPGNG